VDPDPEPEPEPEPAYAYTGGQNLWTAAGGGLQYGVAFGYRCTWMSSFSRFHIFDVNNVLFESIPANGSIGIYNISTSQWVNWSAPPDYASVNNVRCFRTSSGKWYLDHLP